MRLLAGRTFFFTWMVLALPADGQTTQRALFKAKVFLTAGGWISGTLDEVDNGMLYFVPYREMRSHQTPLTSAAVPLAEVSWVTVKRTENRPAIRTGLTLGALLGGYLGYQSSQKNRFRSPIIGGVSIGLSALTVAVTGALAGSLLGVPTRRTIRPLDAVSPAQSLERQLKPYTKVYLEESQLAPK